MFDQVVLLGGDQATIIVAVLELYAAVLSQGRIASDTEELNDGELIVELASAIHRQLRP